MSKVFKTQLENFVLVYLDDIFVYSKTKQEHVLHLRIVLENLRKHKLYANPPKWDFMRTTFNYLGHDIGPQGISGEQGKIQAMKSWPRPTIKVGV